MILNLTTHIYGCRVIQRFLEHCPYAPLCRIYNLLAHCRESECMEIREAIYSEMSNIVSDQFGNYVAQFMLRGGNEEDKVR